MGNTSKRYTQEFKDSAIQLALNSEESTLQIAKDLGVSSQTLYGWLNTHQEKYNLKDNSSGNHHKSNATKESLEEENRRLRKELASVKKDREILKKAAAYFAKEAH